MRIQTLLPLFLLAACGPVAVPSATLEGPIIDTPAFETYVTAHNGHSRVRRNLATDDDLTIIADFEDGDGHDPEGYRNLIALDESLYAGRITAEVLAEVDGPEGPARRLLRLTIDQIPYQTEYEGEAVDPAGRFYLRGANFAWVTIDDGPLLSGQDQRGLVDMVLDFETETVSLNLRTGQDEISEIRTEILADSLPLNVRTGAFGGDIDIGVWDPDSSDTLTVQGSLRGQLGGVPDYIDGPHEMSTSGLYAGEGEDAATGRRVRIEGLFVGRDPNVLP